MKVELGDEVKDKVTGFQGIAVAKHQYLQGCARFSVQPPIDKDSKHPDSVGFDEMQLEIIKKNAVSRTEPTQQESESKVTGGPEQYADTSRDV